MNIHSKGKSVFDLRKSSRKYPVIHMTILTFKIKVDIHCIDKAQVFFPSRGCCHMNQYLIRTMIIEIGHLIFIKSKGVVISSNRCPNPIAITTDFQKECSALPLTIEDHYASYPFCSRFNERLEVQNVDFWRKGKLNQAKQIHFSFSVLSWLIQSQPDIFWDPKTERWHTVPSSKNPVTLLRNQSNKDFLKACPKMNFLTNFGFHGNHDQRFFGGSHFQIFDWESGPFSKIKNLAPRVTPFMV